MRNDDLLTTAQVLDFLQIGRTKLWSLVRTGSISAFRIGGGPNGSLRYRRADIVEWLESQRVVGTSAVEDEKQYG
ncbi:MAG: helix-turn-helix domain-containing protein [Myxococcales bacterium]|nr:helix-turn-helix domain-containing protein [Myxococcales bacterium]